MSSITLSAVARQNLASLQDIASQIALAQKRLATGRRVNSPSEDPYAYFTSISLTARGANISRLMDAMSSAQSTLDAASKGIATIQSLINSAQSVANQALAAATTFVKITGTNSTALTTSSTIASNGGSSTRLRAGDQVTVSDGTTTATYTAASNDTVQTLLNAINTTANLKVSASLNANGQISFQATSNVDVTVGATLTGTGTLSSVLGLTAGTTTFTASTVRQSLAQQFDLIRTQIDQAVGDASYNGVNLLSGGSLSVVFNESGSSKLSVGGPTLSASSLGIAAATNAFQTDGDVQAALTGLGGALTTLQSNAAVLGSQASIVKVRQDFSKALVDQLKSGADTLVAANVEEDSALLLALRTRQQVATSLLSLTQGSDQNVLRLFGL